MEDGMCRTPDGVVVMPEVVLGEGDEVGGIFYGNVGFFSVTVLLRERGTIQLQV